MAVFKCKMCGGTLEVQERMTVCECDYCGSVQTVPQLDDEKKINLFTRANRLRSACEFDKASRVYETIVADFPEEAEAYWGILLCKFGIEYVDDPKTSKKIPTCHRSAFDSIMDDQDFEMVMEYSDSTSRAIYRNEAKAIEELRIGINEVSSKEEPYDIFICYKETDVMGERTIDSVIAQDVYDALVEKGYKVFFSRITLEDKLGKEYEPYIFAALNSAKVMLAFGTDYEYYNAVWVKNEWSRFLGLIEKGAKKTLIPCYKGIDAYDMPKEFARLQAQDMGKVGAIQDLLRGIGKILGSMSGSSGNVLGGVTSAEGSALTQRGNMALEDGDFEGAEGYFERALDANPSDAHAYLGKFLAFHGLSSLNDLDDKVYILDDNKEFRRAEQFADATLKKDLQAVRDANELKIERLRIIELLKKLYRKKGNEELDSMKKSAYEHLMLRSSEGEKEARDIYSSLLSAGIVSSHTYQQLIERIHITQGISMVLSDCEIHASSAIGKEGTLHRYSSIDVSRVLRDLVSYELIEHSDLGYSLIGAKEEKERLLKEAEERRQREARQKTAYDEACTAVNRQIQEEIDTQVSRLSEDYDSRLNGIQREINEEVSECNRQRESIERQISDWRSQQSSLGFFKGKERKVLQAQIDEAQNRLNAIPTQQQIQANHQPAINQVNADKKAEIDRISAEVRSQYVMPKLEDFAEAATE